MNQANSTEIIKTAINVFILIAVGVSLFQELDFTSKSSVNPQEPQAPVAEINANGTKVEGLVIITSDHFRKELKELLIQQDYNIEIKEFPFEGNEYWLNMFLTHGHMIVVFFLVSRYQSETDQSKKTKWMILGMALVFGWMFLSPQLKPKRIGLQFKGVKVYERESYSKDEFAAKLVVYEEESVFDLDPIREAPQPEKVIPEAQAAPESEVIEEPQQEIEF